MRLLDLYHEKKERERRQKKIDTATKLAVGSLIGVITGILLAPKSGKETRHHLANKTKEVAESAKNTLKDSIGNFKEVEDKVKERVREFKDRDMFEIELEQDRTLEEVEEEK
ncbi:MAG: YtxH domain-containing protein [Tissierellia bacterium]|nr:YtxH domain-containing protein [Tissierellia bacterium]